MKKFVCLFFIFIFSISIISFFGCENNAQTSANQIIKVEEVVINKSHAYCNEGEKIVLLAQVYPFNANNQNIIWKSDNPNIAVVSNGVVEGVATGKTIITAESEDGNFCDSCVVFVSTPKLNYDKYKNKLTSLNSVENEDLDNNYFSSFEKIFNEIENFNNLIKNEINSAFERLDDEINKIKLQKINNTEKKEITTESEDSGENLDNGKVYYFEYKYNSNGIDDEKDEFTTYKDENTIVKEYSF